MGMNFSVRIVDEDGNGVEDKLVTASFGVTHGQKEDFTDEEGWAQFETFGDYTSAKIYVDGECLGECDLEYDDTCSFTI